MKKNIQSVDNVIYKNALSLQQKKQREKQEAYLIEGPNLLREALENNGVLIQVFCREAFDGQRLEQLTLLNELEKRSIPMSILSEKLFQKLCDTQTPQGIVGVVKKPCYSEETFFKTTSNRQNSNVLVLDRLQDPGNLGTILRTADAAGFQGVLVRKGTGDLFAPKVVRSAAGALFRLPVFFTDSVEETIGYLRKYGKRIVATTLQKSKLYYEANLCGNIGLIIGNEGNGICQEFIDQADETIRIPMEGTVESLNAAVAAGILMYEAVRQKQQR